MNNLIHVYQKTLGILFCAASLTACSSGPEHVTASRPLVEQVQYSNHKLVPEQYWLDLDTQKGTFSFTYKGSSVTVGQTYLSALGNICRPIMTKSAISVDKRVVCRNKQAQGWYLTPDIILMDSDEFSF